MTLGFPRACCVICNAPNAASPQKPAVVVDVKEASHKGVDVHGEDGLGEMRPPLIPSDKVCPTALSTSVPVNLIWP